MKVAIYCRLSEEDRDKQFDTDDSNSIQNQKDMLLQYAVEQHWELYNIYSDDDYAGADRNRPEFVRLIKDAEERKFEIVLCKTQSRFTRELELVEKYIHGLFPMWGIRFVSIVDNADTLNKGNKKSRQINGLVNEWYLEDMSDNIKSVLTSRRKNGYHIGSFAPYGYKKDSKIKGHLIIDEDAASIVREVFILFSKGYGKTAIARLLNNRGVPNPTEYKRLQGLRYQQPKERASTLWKYSSISSMLLNEMYIGHMVQGRYGSSSYKTKKNIPRPKSEWLRVENTHDAIIERDLWNQVQSLIARRTKPFDVGTVGLFAGKARCLNCGYLMRSSKSRGRHYLQCPNHHVAKDACIGAFISVDTLEHIVLSELQCLTEKYLNKSELQSNLQIFNDLDEHKKSLYLELNTYEKRFMECKQCSRQLYKDKIKGIISEDDFICLSKEFSEERELLKQKKEKAEQMLTDLSERMKQGDDSKKMMEQYITTHHLTHELIEIMIDYICIGKRMNGIKVAPIEIHWNF